MSKLVFLLSSLAFGSFLAACSAAPVATTQPPAKVGKTFPSAADAPVFAGTNFKAMQIFDLEAGLYLDEAALLEALDDDKLVFMGEQHATAPVQELELWLLTRMTKRHPTDVSLGMEHFQHDSQSVIDSYLAGSITSDQFEATAKPWKDYAIYWKPLVDHMKDQGRPVVGLNVPDDALSELYAAFPKSPLATFNTWPTTSQWDPFVAPRPIPMWDDTYKAYFEGDFDYNAHGKQLGLNYADALVYFTDLATIRDETMAYWVSQQLANAGGRVMIVAGDWHVQTGLATPDRAVRYAGDSPKTDLVTTTPAANLAAMRAKLVAGRKVAHFAFVYQ